MSRRGQKAALKAKREHGSLPVTADSDVPCLVAMDTIHYLWHQLVDSHQVNNMRFHIEVPDTDPEVCIVFVAGVMFKKESEEIGEAAYKAMSQKIAEKYGVPKNAPTK